MCGKCRHVSEREYPEFTKDSKDTSLANDYWRFCHFDRFDQTGVSQLPGIISPSDARNNYF